MLFLKRNFMDILINKIHYLSGFNHKVGMPAPQLAHVGKASSITSASITVEASISLSLFILFFASILSLFGTLRSQVISTYELDKNVQGIAAYVAMTDNSESDEIYLTTFTSDRIAFLPEWIGSIVTSQEACRRAWTGRIITGGENKKTADDVYVYVAENGSVYHTTDACTYLNLSVREVSAGSIASLRNSSGAKYYPCEKCGGTGDAVYITGDGTRYHSDKNCSSLKRNFKKVKKSEVSLPPCGRCGG